MSRQRPNFVQRFVPDINRLFAFSNGMMSSHQGSNGSVDPHSLNYEGNNLNELTRRQMIEDIDAYRYDLDFCRNQLTAPDLTAQETRTLQIRVLDCGHNIRHCQHRIQLIEAQEARRAAASVAAAAPAVNSHRQHRISTPSVGVKRKLPTVDSDDDDEENKELDISLDGPGTNNVQRLGFWKCRLCVSRKFLDAGTNRVPSAPCKWPLKDVSKILNHYLDMHTEHTVEERCAELGAALAHNRGPFEYWLTRTRGQDLSEDNTIIDTYIEILQSGSLPVPLRGLSRAAAKFPPTAAGLER